LIQQQEQVEVLELIHEQLVQQLLALKLQLEIWLKLSCCCFLAQFLSRYR